MLENVTTTCEASDCGRHLTDDHLMLAMASAGGVRRAYECDCGAVTVTIARE